MWPFENATLKPTDMGPGLVPGRFLGYVFTSFTLLGFVFLWLHTMPTLPLGLLALATLMLARQLALDLCHETLLDIYTLPLALLGLVWAVVYGVGFIYSLFGGVLGLGVALVLAWVVARIKPGTSGLGGGDIKFLALMGLWLGPWGWLLGLVLANVINLAIALAFNRASLPQGPGLIIALWVMVVWPQALIGLFLSLMGRI